MTGRPPYRLIPLALICLVLATATATAAPPEVPGVWMPVDRGTIKFSPIVTAGYDIHRGDLAGLHGSDYGSCLLGSVQGTSAPVPDDPPPGTGYFYLVGGYDETGPGPYGTSSGGTPRTPSPLCPPNRRFFELIADDAPDGLPSREPFRNPSFEDWWSKREWTGVALHSGEFTLMSIDPVGGAPKPYSSALNPTWGGGGGNPSAEAVAGGGGGGRISISSSSIGIASGGAKFFPGRPVCSTCSGGGGSGGLVVQELAETGEISDTGVGQSIAINEVDNTTRAAIGDSATVSGGTGAAVTVKGTSKAEAKKEGSWLKRWLERIRKQYLSRVEGFRRNYRSQIHYDGPLGFGWDFPHNKRLVPDGSDVIWYDGMGRRWLFHRISATEFISPMGCYAKLWEDAAYFYLRFPDGTIQDYSLFDGTSTQGALLRDISPGGNHSTYFYDIHGFLQKIEDTLGRALTFAYNPEGRITTITDHAGRSTEYSYDPVGNLISVRSPLVTGTLTGNDFPAGKVTTYSYTSGHPDPRYNHNLWTITSPNEQGSLIPFMDLSYEPDPNNFAFDRVTGQVIGGVGSGGAPPAGGGMTYSYVPMNLGGDPFDMALPRREITVIDRMGNERVWLTNAAGNPIQLVERTNRGLRPGEPDYITQATYNPDGEILSLRLPEGNEVLMTYDRPGADRYREGNILELRLVPDQPFAGGRGDGHGVNLGDIVWNYSYDPLGRRISSVTDPMGRQYRWIFDYQEGDPNTNGAEWLSDNLGVDFGGIPFFLGDLNGDGTVADGYGRPVVVERPSVNLESGSHQAAIEGDLVQEIRTVLTWNGHGQLASVLDPEGNLHLFEYYPENDPDGDGTPTPPPSSRVLDTSTGGYLKKVTLDTLSAPGRNNGTDPPPANIDSDYEYDSVGNRISSVNARGVRTSWTYNQLGQVVETRRASATGTLAGPHGDPATGRGETGLPPLGYRVWFFYDANDNLVERHTEEIGGSTGAGPWIETRWGHDILDNVYSSEHEVAAATFVTTNYEYDANERPVLVVHPIGNVDDRSYDERNLLLSATRGVVGPRGGTPSTRQYEYDGNGNLTRLTDGRGGLIDYEYDGADRLARTVDQVGSTADAWYDPAGNLSQYILRGPTGGATPPDRTGATNVDLYVSNYSYDDLNRLVIIEKALNIASGTPPVRPPILQEGPLDPGNGAIDHVYEYDRLSRLTFDINDLAAVSRYDYDGAGRLLLADDAGTRLLDWTRDGNGNPVELVEHEHPSSPGPPTEEWPTTWFYDALDRLTMEVNSAGETRHWLYNSMDLVEIESDALGPAGGTIDRRSDFFSGHTVSVNAHGNVTGYAYDGMGRLTVTNRVLTLNGLGDGTSAPPPGTANPSNPDGLITLVTQWDDNSLVLARSDDNGNTTWYEYDNLDRATVVRADDDTFSSYAYDQEDNVIQTVDPNGNLIDRLYDPAHRIISATVTPAPGIPGSTLQTYEYDGLNRLTRAFDINEPALPVDDVEISYTYDSLGRVVEEHQIQGPGPVLTTSYGWYAEDLRTEVITPSSVPTQYSYDAQGRMVQAAGGAASATFGYFGRDRVHTRDFGNGIRSTMLDSSGTLDIGYDQARRVQWMVNMDPNWSLLAGYQYKFDRNGNRLGVHRMHQPDPNGLYGEVYFYDSASRLGDWAEGPLDPNFVLITTTLISRTWTLDGAGNWAEHGINTTLLTNTPNNNNEYDELQGGGTRVDDGIADDFADMFATPPNDGMNLAHDMNGSQTFDGTHELRYDAFGRLVQVVEPAIPAVVSTYSYDPLGRRITKEVTNRGSLNTYRRYLYAGTRVVEERDAASAVTRTAAFGRHDGEPLWQSDGAAHQYYIQDPHGSVVAMADDAFPDIIERVTYTPYGTPLFLDPNNVPLTDPNSGLLLPASTVGNPLLFAGMRHDPEGGGCPGGAWGPECGGLYVTLHRYYSPYQGRFLSRDPLGVWADRTAVGNGYAYAGGNPVNLTDPLGLGPGDGGVVGGTVVDVGLPSGPFLRVEGTGVELTVPGQTLSGDFAFEKTKPAESPRLIKIDAAEVPADVGGDEFKVMFNPKEYTIEKAAPWREPSWKFVSDAWLDSWWQRVVARWRAAMDRPRAAELPPKTGVPRGLGFSGGGSWSSGSGGGNFGRVRVGRTRDCESNAGATGGRTCGANGTCVQCK